MADIEAILQKRKEGFTFRGIAEELNTTVGTVAGVVKRHAQPEKIIRLEQREGITTAPRLGEFNEALARLERDKRYIIVEHDPDNHFPYHDPDAQAERSAIRQRIQPDIIVVGSDAGDFPTISRFELDRRIPTGRALTRFRHSWFDHVDQISYDAPKAVNVWIDGNHDERAWLALEADENYNILHDYHVQTITANNRVYWRGTGKESLSVTIANTLIVTHGTKASTHTAAATLDQYDRQYSVMAGHSHRPDFFTRGTKYTVTATIGGCGCLLSPIYDRRNLFSGWQHGYQYAVVDTYTQTAHLELITFKHSEDRVSALVNGEIISIKKHTELEALEKSA